MKSSVKEKQSFIFFVNESSDKWRKNKKIFLFYLNRIAVNEHDECEVFSVEKVNKKYRINYGSGWNNYLNFISKIHILNKVYLLLFCNVISLKVL